ncbi:MAG: butyrate kinase [Acholeplasmataceae bacterium]|nr:butyrate kinase [Acholeplasmataceae bacterium]
MPYHILTINPGSTSTKLAIYEDEEQIYKASIKHDTEEILKYTYVWDQFDFRMDQIRKEIEKSKIDLGSLDAIVGRGGMLKPLTSGTYHVNDDMIEFLKNRTRGEHASNLGCGLAKELAAPLGIPSFIVDPVSVDEMEDIARYTGMPELQRQCIFHALNHKAIARLASQDLNTPYNELNLIIAHLGGGISVASHKKGRVIDVNNALDGDGPMSPERSGSVPIGPLYKMVFSGKYTLEEMKRKNYGKGGLVAYLGTNDGSEIQKRIENGDKEAEFIYNVMCYQIAKEIGAQSAVLKGDVDRIILTGGLAYDAYTVKLIKERVEFIAPVMVYPGEDEMGALAKGALRVLKGEEVAKEYK